MLSIPIAWAAQQATDKIQSQADPAMGGVSDLITQVLVSVPLWIAAAIVFFLTVLIANLAKSSAKRAIVKAKGEDIHEGSVILVGRVTYMGILSIGFVISLQIAGIDLGWLLGAIGLGIGFSMKDLINNFISGVIILLQNQINIGDFVAVGDTKGTIIDILPNVTILQALDGTKVTIPNGRILAKEFICFTSNPTRRIEIEIGVEFSTNLDNAQKVIVDVLALNKDIEPKPAPYVITKKINESSILLSARFWVLSRSKWVHTKSDVIRDIKKAFDDQGINIPFPIRTIYGTKDHPQFFGKTDSPSQ